MLTTQVTIPVGAHLFDERLHQTEITEYGISIQELMRGEVALPPEGARFDIAYEGAIEGDRLRGVIDGVDYAEVRADGRFQLHIHASITTEDGEKIALYGDGVSGWPDVGTGLAQLRLNMRLSTSSPAYTWVNQLQVWGHGTVNPNTGQIRVSTYTA